LFEYTKENSCDNGDKNNNCCDNSIDDDDDDNSVGNSEL